MDKKTNKKLLFLGRRDDRVDFDTPWSVVAALHPLATTVAYSDCFLEEIGVVYDGEQLRMYDRDGNDLTSYDAIFLLGWFKLRQHEEIAQVVSLYAVANGIKVLNSEALHNRSRGKVSQYVRAALSDVSTMPFVICIDHERLPELIKKSGISYPMIVKSITGSRGRDNYLVKSEDELRKALVGTPDKAFVIQPFIPNDGDYRLLVAGNKVRLAIHRQAASDSHLNNTSQGGKATLVELGVLTPKMLEDALAVSSMLRREVTGVDMVIHRDSGQHYFLEANNMPQISTGSFVPEKALMLNEYFTEWVNGT